MTALSAILIQLDQFQTKMAEMSNLRWLRLNRSQLGSLPDEIDQFQKLVCVLLASCGSGRDTPSLSTVRRF